MSRWKRHIVVNSMQARLRAQLGDSSKYNGERRRRSVVVASIVLTITDPLRGSYLLLYNLQVALIRLHGVNHNQPFPTANQELLWSVSSLFSMTDDGQNV